MTSVSTRMVLILTAIATLSIAAPAQAQFFWISPDNRGAPVQPGEAGIGIPLPGATPAEEKAALTWTLRTGLNSAALQCQFEPMLQTVENYNRALDKHEREFVQSYQTIEGYFKRTQGRSWQAQFDTYRTRLYNYFTPIQAKLTFCQAAGKIGQDAVFTPVGSMENLARNRMREFRNSLIYRVDQVRVLYPVSYYPLVAPSFNPQCYDRRNELKSDCATAYRQALAAPKYPVYY